MLSRYYRYIVNDFFGVNIWMEADGKPNDMRRPMSIARYLNQIFLKVIWLWESMNITIYLIVWASFAENLVWLLLWTVDIKQPEVTGLPFVCVLFWLAAPHQRLCLHNQRRKPALWSWVFILSKKAREKLTWCMETIGTCFMYLFWNNWL